MKKIILAIAIGLAAIAPATPAADALKTHPDTTGWADLFAADFSNAAYSPRSWAWKDGVLSSQGKDGSIWTKQQYENFMLDLEFKLETNSNSGVFIYSTDTGKSWVKNTVEIQLLDDAGPKWTSLPPNQKCAGIFGHSVPMATAVKPPGEWIG